MDNCRHIQFSHTAPCGGGKATRIIISGGGTGGHIFPAIAIANALKKLQSNIEILFVGAQDKMEMEKVPAAGYEIVGLNISGLNRSSLLKNVAFPFKLISSLIKSARIIKSFKPNVVVGVGGFASGPIMYAASAKKIPTVIQEQNSYAGITNKLLGAKASLICVAYDGMERFFPNKEIIRTGNPVRQDILNLEGKRALGQQTFQLEPSKKTLLVIGGSLGARSINLAIEAHLDAFKKADIQVVWQTGKHFIDRAKKAVADAQATHVFVSDFIYTMDQAYAVADVVLSRAGASSISELCIVGKPSILVPFPYAAEDHQTKNAQALVDADAAILVPDNEAQERACTEALTLLNNPEKQAQFSRNAQELGYPNADEKIATHILKLASQT